MTTITKSIAITAFLFASVVAGFTYGAVTSENDSVRTALWEFVDGKPKAEAVASTRH